MSGTLLVFSIFKISVYECSVWLLRNDTGKKKKKKPKNDNFEIFWWVAAGVDI